MENLTKEDCLDILKRFTGRRGTPQTIYSDNSTTFIGARGELEFRRLIRDEEFKDLINNFASQNHIDWFTIPPRTPHFGGLWEAAVKSMNRHHYRTVGSTKLSTSAFTTLLTTNWGHPQFSPSKSAINRHQGSHSFNSWPFHHRKTHHSYTRVIFTKEQNLVTTLEKHRHNDSSVLEEMECRILIFIAAAEQMEDRIRTASSGRYCDHQRRQHSPNVLAPCSYNTDIRP